jgi:hypothetical protein
MQSESVLNLNASSELPELSFRGAAGDDRVAPCWLGPAIAAVSHFARIHKRLSRHSENLRLLFPELESLPHQDTLNRLLAAIRQDTCLALTPLDSGQRASQDNSVVNRQQTKLDSPTCHPALASIRGHPTHPKSCNLPNNCDRINSLNSRLNSDRAQRRRSNFPYRRRGGALS